MTELLGVVDLQKYSGVWLEMARKPAFFQKSFNAPKAHYKLDGDKIIVENSCIDDNGNKKIALGVAKIKGERCLAVKFSIFMNIFNKPNYEIIFIDESYQVAIVGAPNKKYLWILSRKVLPKEQIDELLIIAQNRGFDISDIIYDKH